VQAILRLPGDFNDLRRNPLLSLTQLFSDAGKGGDSTRPIPLRFV
jgi:hypothetical protein